MMIYVGNLSLDITQEELQLLFASYGQVLSVTIMNDNYIGSGQTRGYGYVGMASKAEGETAINELQGKSVKGREIDLVEALPLSSASHGNLHSHKISPFSGKARRRGC